MLYHQPIKCSINVMNLQYKFLPRQKTAEVPQVIGIHHNVQVIDHPLRSLTLLQGKHIILKHTHPVSGSRFNTDSCASKHVILRKKNN